MLLAARPGDEVAGTLRSVAAQSYPGYEVCHEEVAEDGLAAALSRALACATGELVVRVEAGDALGVHALAWFVHAALEDDQRDVIYADQDVRAWGVRSDPRFKPDWSPEALLAAPYLGNPIAYRRALVEEVGGYRAAHAGALDYDLALRATQGARCVHHIPRILYHARGVPAPLGAAGQRAVEAALAARDVEATVASERFGYRVRRTLATRPRVALLIPTRDRRDLLERCLATHWERTAYPACEVVVIDDGSEAPTRLWLEGLAAAGRVTLLRRDAPFNYAALINQGAAATDAEVLVLLNNDTEVLAADWLETMLEHALRPDVGAVGARLLYRNGAVQHAGVVLGVGPDRVAADAHQGEPAGSGGYLGRVMRTHECSAVTGACLMVRRDVFQAVGGLDADALPVSFNDVDFCLRLRERGLRTIYTPYATLIHDGSASRSRATDPREIAVMKARWGDLLADDPCYSPHLTRARFDFSWSAS